MRARIVTILIVLACTAGVILVGTAQGSAPAKAQISPKPEVGQIYIQIESAKIEAIRTLATAQLLTAQWAHVQACTGAGARWWDAMDCDNLLAQLEAAKGGSDE